MSGVYPFGPQKPPRLSPNGGGVARSSQNRGCKESPWYAVAVVPRTDVEGKHFGSELPEYQCVLEHNRRTNEYRTRPLTEVLEGD